MSASEQPIVMPLSPLERIAIALERIADALDDKHAQKLRVVKDETPFPWAEVGVRLQNAERRSRRPEDPPTTVERLIRIGRRELYTNEWRNVGITTIEGEIDPIMERLGFGEVWKGS